MYIIIKRCFDFFSATILFIVISPLFFILCFLIWAKIGRPVFFRQERTGKDKKVFEIIKFRTMTNSRNGNGELLPDEERKTKLGAWLRTMSLDELPELLNIIKGDMSVIGPRPLRPRDYPYYREHELNRFKVRGGLIPPETLYDIATPTWDDQLKWEADYANHACLSLDIKILFKVFRLLFNRNKKQYGDYVREDLEIERKNECRNSELIYRH